MRFEGLIKSWDDDRGFGFIEPAKGGDEIFVHITAFPARSGRPALKQRVSFEVELDRDNKKRAHHVQLVRPARPASRRARNRAAEWGGASLFAVPAFLLLYLGLAVTWGVPRLVAGAYLMLSVVCFILYAADKSAAATGARRTQERTLLAIGLLGGWPGGLVAQQLLRHKSIKSSFRAAFWATVIVNVVAFVALSSPWLGAWRWLG
jgi:uncharacterized membrane protein YsdA (DUF1294 family)/cold shock CspA family protein